VTLTMVGTLPLAVRSLRRGEMDGLKDLREIDDAALPVQNAPLWSRVSRHLSPVSPSMAIING